MKIVMRAFRTLVQLEYGVYTKNSFHGVYFPTVLSGKCILLLVYFPKSTSFAEVLICFVRLKHQHPAAVLYIKKMSMHAVV